MSRLPRSAAVALLVAGAAAAREPLPDRFRSLEAELQRDHRDPRALAVLAELRRQEGDLEDLPAASAVYARLAADPEAHPEARAAALLAVAELDRARGNLARAGEELSRLGFVDRWWVAGPFDNEGKRGFASVFPPEEAVDVAKPMPGKVRPVRWRPLPPEALQLGFAVLSAALRPVRETTAYALATLDSPREQRVRLYVGASGAVKLWVNGALALSDEAYHPARLDQAAVAVTLRKGPNRLLVKLCHEEGQMALAVRVASAAGEPLRLAELPTTEPPPPAPRPAAPAPSPVPTLVSLLERRAAAAAAAGKGAKPGSPAARAEARARADLARVLDEKRSADDRERRPAEEARRAARLVPGEAWARLLAARLEQDGNRQWELLEAARTAAPRDPEVLSALGLHQLVRGRPHRALPLLRAAAAAAPTARARLAVADAWEAVGFQARAFRERAAVAAAFPLSPAAAAAAARAARALDRLDEAARLWRKALALRFDDASTRYALERLAAATGDVDGAVALLEEGLRLAPGDLAARLRLADLLAANGRNEEAEAAFAAAARICPDDPDVWERRGRARLRAGRTADAVEDLQVTLELRPQDPQVKELLRAVQPARERFEDPYLLDARALAREYQAGAGHARRPPDGAGRERAGVAAGPPAPEQADDAVILGELRVVKVYPSGLSSRVHQLVVKVLTDRGADRLRTHVFGYTPGRQELRVERARVTRPDGTVLESAQESDRSASEPWYRLFYDVRARVVSFPQLQRGDLLELTTRTDDVAGENLLSDYFGDLVFLRGATRRLRWEYVLLMPPGRTIHASDPPAGLARADRELPGGSEHRWTARDLAPLPSEPGEPGPSETTPFLHVSTYATWEQVATFWWGLVREQLVPDAEVRATAERIRRETLAARRAAGLPESGDERALVEAVHAFVVTNIRYVGLEFGIHGFKPYRVDEVLSRRYGDCKDKASLTHALLGVLGIDSRLVLLRMRHLGAMPDRPASLSIFNHAITWVPDFDLWLDGTAGFHGTHDLPGEDRGATVLVVNPGAPPRFTRIPPARPEENVTATTMEIRLDAGGAAAMDGETRVRGQPAAAYRRAYQSEADRRAALEQAFARVFPGLTVKKVTASDLSRLEEDVVLGYRLEEPRFADRTDGTLTFRPFGAVQGYVEGYAPTSTRREDLVIGDPHELSFAYRILLPEGSTADLPPPARAETPFGTWEVALRAEPGAVRADCRVVFRTGRVAAADYPAFRAFLSGLDQALARRVAVHAPVRAAAPPPGAAGSAP